MGPGLPEFSTTATTTEYGIKLTAEGIYTCTGGVTDTDGQTYTDSVTVTVLNKGDMDTLLKAKWGGMKVALNNGDIIIATSYILDSQSSKYKEIFETLKDEFVTIFSQTAYFTFISEADNQAEYENIVIEDGTAYLYPVRFVKDGNGLWKIKQF